MNIITHAQPESHLKKVLEQPKHLYIHWPFCSSKCHYCDFVAFEQHEDYQEAYHRILCNEIASFADVWPNSNTHPIDTIFLGGGTPSLYHLPWITELFQLLKQKFSLTSTHEITIETNPADIDEEKLETWRELGISRISVGLQSLDDDVLLKLNRRQRAQDVLRTMRIAPKYFDNISIDLILGLPGVSREMWIATLKQVVTWPIKHISIYFLTVHEKTPLYFKVSRGEVSLEDDQTMITLYEQTVTMLSQHGFEQYEISNFARQGHASLHNQAYWNRRPYKGFGVGASSFDGHKRSTNDNNLTQYLKSGIKGSCSIQQTQEHLSREQELLEILMLSLRQTKGLDLQHMVYLLQAHEKEKFFLNLEQCIHAGLIERQGNIIKLTLKGMALENEIIVRLL